MSNWPDCMSLDCGRNPAQTRRGTCKLLPERTLVARLGHRTQTLIGKKGEMEEKVKTFYSELVEDISNQTQMEEELVDGTEETKTPSIERVRNPILASLEDDKETFESPDKMNSKSFRIIEKIGTGAFGSIFKVVYNDNTKIYAMKVISKSYLFRTKQLKYALSESKLLKIVNHPFVIKMHFAFQDPQYLYFVLDYCCYGDLSMHIYNKQVFNEDDAKFYITELILALEYLHSLNIVYRDLKPDNILLSKFIHTIRRGWSY